MAKRKKGGQADPEHRDPITQTPGAHPVGVGAGAAGAGVAGAALGDTPWTEELLNIAFSSARYPA